MKLVGTTLILLGFLFLTSCGLQKEGLVLMTDQSYKASVFATNKTGIGSPDGLVWHKGRLYSADEAASGFEIWRKDCRLKTFMDSSFGISSPQKIVVDHEGNAVFTDDDVVE